MVGQNFCTAPYFGSWTVSLSSLFLLSLSVSFFQKGRMFDCGIIQAQKRERERERERERATLQPSTQTNTYTHIYNISYPFVARAQSAQPSPAYKSFRPLIGLPSVSLSASLALLAHPLLLASVAYNPRYLFLIRFLFSRDIGHRSSSPVRNPLCTFP